MGETTKLNAAVKLGTLEGLKAAFGNVGGACKNCHGSVRANATDAAMSRPQLQA
jgi:cytochrome c556